jgi:DNA repair exonuclease SbcCD ATPase subunit
MRLLSIAARNYRIHANLQVSLDPLRTVISGPNESGKSTLLEAAHRSLFLRSKTTGEIQKGMVSRVHAGHPEAEAVFESGGVTYRVLKRFSGASGTTTLTDSNGKTWNGDEAEVKLASVLGVEAPAGGRGAGERVLQQWAHLWVRQGTSGLDPTFLATAQHAPLLARLQAIGGAAAMQSERDVRVATMLRAQDELVFTQADVYRANSAPALAVAEHEAAEGAVEQSKLILAKLVEAANELQIALKTIERSDAGLGQLRPQLVATESKITNASELRIQDKAQRLAVAAAVDKHETLERAEVSIANFRAELNKATEALTPQKLKTDQLVETEAEFRNELNQLEVIWQTASTDLRAIRLTSDLTEAYLRQFEKSSQRDQINKNLERIREMRTKLEALEALVAQSTPVTAEKIKKLRKLEEGCFKAEAKLSAMATGIEIIENVADIFLNEKQMAKGDSYVLTEEADLTIGSDIRVRIRPGGGVTLEDARRSLSESQSALQTELDGHGLKTVAEAVEEAAKFQQLKSEVANAKSNLENLGADAIEEEFSRAQNACLAADAEVERRSALISGGMAAPPNLAEATKNYAQSREQLSDAEQAEALAKGASEEASRVLRNGTQLLSDHKLSLQEAILGVSDLEAQLRLMVETHGNDADRASKLAEVLHSRTEAEGTHALTLQQLESLQPALLEADHSRLTRAVEQLANAKTEAEQNRAVCRSKLQRDGSADPQADLALAEATSRAARQRRERAETKAAASRLLHKMFDEEQKKQAHEFSQPFASKIGGYLECLFGAGTSAKLTLDGNAFSELQLIRNPDTKGTYDFQSLSGGTSEQVAAAVRLTMAEILAESHHGCLPVIFDDAFVNSDPERIQTLQRMLDHAAGMGLQVIIVTCNPSDYAGFGACSVPLPAVGRT